LILPPNQLDVDAVVTPHHLEGTGPRVVPPTAGLTAAAASAALESLGFKVSGIIGSAPRRCYHTIRRRARAGPFGSSVQIIMADLTPSPFFHSRTDGQSA